MVQWYSFRLMSGAPQVRIQSVVYNLFRVKIFLLEFKFVKEVSLRHYRIVRGYDKLYYTAGIYIRVVYSIGTTVPLKRELAFSRFLMEGSVNIKDNFRTFRTN